jgi:Na+/H+ antiporter NhaA
MADNRRFGASGFVRDVWLYRGDQTVTGHLETSQRNSRPDCTALGGIVTDIAIWRNVNIGNGRATEGCGVGVSKGGRGSLQSLETLQVKVKV